MRLCATARLWGAGLLAAALLLAIAAPAGAATITSHQFSTSFDGSATPAGSLGLEEITDGLAFNQHAKKLYVLDSVHDVVNVFTASGVFDSQIKGKDTPQGSLDLDRAMIAVDDSGGPTQGRVYVASTDQESIFAFSSTGSYLFQFSIGLLPELYGDLAVAADGSVWVSKVFGQGSRTIYRLSSTGALLEAIPLSIFDISGSPDSLAFGTGGDLYVADDGGKRVLRLSSGGDQMVDKFDYELDSATARGFDADPATEVVYGLGGGHIYFDSRRYSAPHVAVFDDDGDYIDEFGNEVVGEEIEYFDPVTGEKVLKEKGEEKGYPTRMAPITRLAEDAGRGLAVDHAADTVYVGNRRTDEIYVFTPASATAPQTTMGAITAITDDSATINATVDPAGNSTEYHIDYRKPSDLSWNIGPTQDAGDGSSAVAVSREVSGLDFGSTYEVRIQAYSRDTGKRDADSTTFKTVAHTPEVETAPVAPRGTTTARLNARVDPNGSATSYFFEYGSDDGYGTSVPASLDGEAGSERGVVLVSEEISSLAPGTTYHYRVVAENEIGKAEGEDLSFTTRTTAEVAAPERGIELVNPPDKAGQNVLSAYLAPERDRVVWQSSGGTELSPSGGAIAFIADRAASGWESRSFAPPLAEQTGGGQLSYAPFYASVDFSSFISVATAGVLAESDRFLLRLDDERHEQFLHQLRFVNDIPEFMESDTALSRSFISLQEALDPADTNGAGGGETDRDVYLVDGDTPELVSLLPSGTVSACGAVFKGPYTRYPWISSDPAADPRVYFQSTASGLCQKNQYQVYVRDLQAQTTTAVSLPPLSGPVGPARFIRASADGKTAIFVSASRLDVDDTNTTDDIYRYEEGSHTCLTCVTEEADVESVTSSTNTEIAVVVSGDLSRVYFTSPGVLTDDLGPKAGAHNLYVLHKGQLRFIAQIDKSLPGGNDAVALGADGHILIFNTPERGITDDTTAAVSQHYRYDDRDGSLECITCPPPGQKQPGGTLGAGASSVGLFTGALARGQLSVTADGETMAFVSAVAYLPEDVNRSYDVYEWHNGTFTLITDGVSKFPSGLLKPVVFGISRNGTNILFRVGARLTGHELDHASQVYVARVGGGFPPPQIPPAPCVEDSCQGPLQPTPRAAGAASAAFSGPANPSVRKQSKKKKKKRKAKLRKAKQRKAKQRKAKHQHRRHAHKPGSDPAKNRQSQRQGGQHR